MQNDFLSELGLSASEALHQYNLALLCSKRDISLLGLLHHVTLKVTPIQLSNFLRPNIATNFARGWAIQFDRHNQQFHDPLASPVPKIVERSIFKLVHPYNVLPQHVVDSKSLSSFQSKLQGTLKEFALQDIPEWESVLSTGVYKLGIIAFRKNFKFA